MSPASTAANALTVVTIFNNPPGSPAVVTLTARDARAATDSRFQNNIATRNIGIQYLGGPPSATGYYALYSYNGSGAAAWTFAFSDPQGPQNIFWMQIHFSGTSSQSVPSSCALLVYSSGAAYLRDDAGAAWIGGTIGQDAPLRNSQCLIEMKGLRIYDQAGLRYLEVPTYLNPSFLGAKDIWLSVYNNQGQLQPGSWFKVASAYQMYHSMPAASLALHPSQGTSVTQQFRTSAMSTYPGGEIPFISMSVKDPSNNLCQLAMYPPQNWAYLYATNYGYVSDYLTNTSSVMNTPRCSVAVSSLKFTSYTQAAPAAPYAFMDAAIQANAPIRGTSQNMFGSMYYIAGGYWFASPDLYIGFWTIPGSL